MTVSPRKTSDETFFIVKEPVSGDFFRFREAEQFIAQQFDGKTPLEVVRQRTEEHFGAVLPIETLNGFVKSLEKRGLLETGKANRSDKDSHKRIRGGPLYLRFKLFDPSHLFDRLVPWVWFFFTPYFLVLSAGIILLGVGITASNWTEYTEDLDRLYRLSTIPLAFTICFFVVSAHEFAHGLTCRHYGGEVREIGFMLIYFQPAMYCNVSDAWLFPEKQKRLWVSFAGGYFELFLWGLATIAWRLTEADTWVNYVGLIVMTISGIKTFLNFNPLIKLDGYYLLSDYLDVPNLRRRAFRYVGSLTERLVGMARPSLAEVSPRERRIYLIYGLLAVGGSFLFMGYAVVVTGGLLIDMGQPIVLLLLATLVGSKFRRRFRRMYGRPGASDPDDEDEDEEEDETPDRVGPRDAAEPRKKKRTSSKSLKRWPVWLGLAGTAAAFGYFGHTELRISGPFNVLPVENADVRTAVEGIVEQVYVDEGDAVKAGDLIARLSPGSLLSDIEKTEAEMNENRATLQKLVAGATAAEIEVARAIVSKSRDQLKYAQERLPRYIQLLEEGLVSQVEFEEAQQAVTIAQNDLVEAQRRLDVLLIGTRPEEIEATRARVERLEAQRRYIKEQLGLLQVTSPVSGVIGTPSRQLKQMTHQFAIKGALIAKVYDVGTVTVQILISEAEIADIHVGQRVVLRARAHPDEEFEGTVKFIATSVQGGSSPGDAESTGSVSSGTHSGHKTVLVTTEIENHSMLLRPEMTGQAKIFCGDRRIFDLIKRRLTRTLKVEFWSWW